MKNKWNVKRVLFESYNQNIPLAVAMTIVVWMFYSSEILFWKTMAYELCITQINRVRLKLLK